ncbi:hypothetical protein [Pseudoprimorskyibacter insulae]|uniref:Uncharacterized protein n=1 Tax=Pseudoprimorskyibacter insulae TaxID=1695997 RepID=A0A2R8AQB3_9RHOB|nr:hypothetical protein [Pseudoprimorskyibacter insulae]SPF78251.1 hypothetical protein PRI8871_00844 [Pseudoprimorskyibacter insulae]
MDLLVASSASLAAVLLYAWAYGVFNSPNPPKWAKSEALASTVALVFTCLTPLGIGFFFRGILGNIAGQSVFGWASIAVAAVVIYMVVPRLVAPARRPKLDNVVPMPTGPSAPRPVKLAA